MLQVTNVAETWQRGYRSVHFLAGYSFLHHWTGFDKAQAKRQCRLFWYTLAAIQAPPCVTTSSIFGAWAASAHGCLPGTILVQYIVKSTSAV